MIQPQDSQVIRCEKLTKRYPNHVVAVDSLDLSVCKGEIFGLLGPNGAGKTTTVGMLTTLVIPTGGKAFVAGIDVLAHPAQVKQTIGVVSQVNNLDRSLTVWENLYYHGRFFGMDSRQSRSAADRLLVEFRLEDRARADVNTISGGMARRLQLARALLHEPTVIFLDEPSAGLDPQTRLALWENLGRLKRQGQTILLTTHYMEEADELCDRVAIIDKGRILALDTPANLKKSTDADSVITLSASGDMDVLERLISSKIGAGGRVTRVDGRLQVFVNGTDAVVPLLLETVSEAGLAVSDFNIRRPSLETVFLKLTGKELRD